MYFRDVSHFFAIVITFWFWWTPIVYSPEILPDWVQPLILLNPLTEYMSAVQGILVSISFHRGASWTLCCLNSYS